jgi:hypothetical protein
VTVWRELVFPTSTVEKFRLVLENARDSPLPVRLTTCGLPGALSAMVRDPVWVSGKLGAKVTVKMQLPPAATLESQVFVAEN